MLSVSCFRKLCANADVKVLFTTETYSFQHDGAPRAVAKERRIDFSDIRYPVVADKSGRKIGVCTDKNFHKYYGKTICLYLPHRIDDYYYYVSVITKIFGWFMPCGTVSAARELTFKNNRSKSNNVFTMPRMGDARIHNGIISLTSRLGYISGAVPLLSYHLRHGLDYIPTDLKDDSVIEYVKLYENGNRTYATTVNPPRVRKAALNYLIDRTPVFEVFFHPLSSDANHEVIESKGLMPFTARIPKFPRKAYDELDSGCFFLAERSRISDRDRNILKLHGVKSYTANGLRAFIPFIRVDDDHISETECLNKLFDFLCDEIGIGDMYLTDPVFYAGTVAHIKTGPTDEKRWEYQQYRTGKMHVLSHIKNEKIRDSLKNWLIQNNT